MSDQAPTTEELQAVLDQITQGTWYATDENEGSDLIINETGSSLLTVTPDNWAMFGTVPDGKAAALAPWAIAEVIRYRKQEGR